jgi:hypothetical protein
MKKNIVISVAVLSIIAWGCQKSDSTPQGLKMSFEKASANINTAISDISSTEAYQLLTASAGQTAKSGTMFNDSITLAIVAGIYDFQPDTVKHYHSPFYPYRLFKKTGESDHMIVNLPQKLMFHSHYLHSYNPADSILKNDFTIDASDYHLYYNWWNNLDYKLMADLMIDSKNMGSLDVTVTSNSFRDQMYSSAFTFSDGYDLITRWQNGDTAVSSFALVNGNDTL